MWDKNAFETGGKRVLHGFLFLKYNVAVLWSRSETNSVNLWRNPLISLYKFLRLRIATSLWASDLVQKLTDRNILHFANFVIWKKTRRKAFFMNKRGSSFYWWPESWTKSDNFVPGDIFALNLLSYMLWSTSQLRPWNEIQFHLFIYMHSNKTSPKETTKAFQWEAPYLKTKFAIH